MVCKIKVFLFIYSVSYLRFAESECLASSEKQGKEERTKKSQQSIETHFRIFLWLAIVTAN